MPIMDYEQQDKTGVRLTKDIIKVPPAPEMIAWLQWEKELLREVWTTEISFFQLIQIAKNMAKSFTYQCKKVFNDEVLIRKLEEEKFDVGIAEAFTVCGFGIFELAKIPTTIAATSTVHLDIVAEAIGEPITPSYVPGARSSAGDQMNFMERIKIIMGTMFGKVFFRDLFQGETAAFREKFGLYFKSFEELFPEVSYVFTNSNPYLDYPRPMIHKTVPIGGIAVSLDTERNKLSERWNTILNERNTTVLVSFGSVAKTVFMPDLYKNSLLTLFESMRETTFIVKYEEERSQMAAHLPNVHLSPWLPQKALLADPRLTVFITHGGLGSITELAHLGKPAIIIPLFAEQPRNADMLAKHGGGIVLTKFDLGKPEKLKETLLKIFNNARFGGLPNLDPYGRQLSLVQYYFLDVILVFVATVIVVICLGIKILRKCVSRLPKVKKD
ncbi:hypothetical protein NECAME_14980 [Necator americanus]|uniref:UDP-glucuronosyltransferase n=1 Tax=Necator americanus TaxID=51031 RepID=W2SK78_NECAM|nr:hypothetical protein NECAME_14980 [Necator americanus]ETN69958.1 hypothetical protein NECAME_14980 [Necator americanus]